MRRVLRSLAEHRWAGVGLALLVELLVLGALSLAPPSAAIGIPAAVATSIAGTVAVVFGIADGVGVALAGSIAFALLNGWGAGELAAIGIWPVIVGAAGLFARRVELHRRALRQLVEAQEEERRSLAQTLHDDSAQTLTGALLTLRAAKEGEPEGEQTIKARELITGTIQQLRRLALDLSPRALQDYGLAAALGHLVESEADLDDRRMAFAHDWDGRLPAEAEWGLFRFAQTALARLRDSGASPITIRLASEAGRVALSVTGHCTAGSAQEIPPALQERIGLLGGRVSATASPSGELILRADVPSQLRLVERASGGAV